MTKVCWWTQKLIAIAIVGTDENLHLPNPRGKTFSGNLQFLLFSMKLTEGIILHRNMLPGVPPTCTAVLECIGGAVFDLTVLYYYNSVILHSCAN